MSDAEGPYGHTPVLGNSTHTGEGCKACGDAKGPYTSYERSDGRGMVEGLNFFFDCRSISEAKRYAERLNTAYAAGRASRDGLREALESCQMSPWLSNLDPLQPLTASLRCESCDRTTQIITKALEADGEGKP